MCVCVCVCERERERDLLENNVHDGDIRERQRDSELSCNVWPFA